VRLESIVAIHLLRDSIKKLEVLEGRREAEVKGLESVR